uniref:CKK domain-containing protein n=1 Tax=Ascaris lumbricoides TaxID=6252 RepID=A0A9J2PDT4_ASCLU
MISGEEANISEAMLASVQPFHQAAHLAVMDALMSAHMRSIITIERVVDAVQNYTTVDKREEPMDSVDALLFWINKICLLVRDDMEKCQAMRKDPNQFGTMVVPEMEDLYEDMCDGACVCALVAFYKPDEMHMQEICFNDPMSVADCHYNLMLLKRFCGTLSFNPFYFEIEDILYLHESLQPNVNAFLADLFDAFESSTTHVASPVDPTPSRRFVPIQTIPDLRSQNYPHRALHPVKMKYVQSSAPRSRSGDSLRYNVPRSRPTLNGTETTNFGELLQASYGDRVSVGTDGLPSTPGGTYSRSDSMPAASIRLALEEKRREHEKKRYLETNLSESERVQKQKDAFFALMQRLEKQGSDTKTRTMSEVGGSGMPSAREIRTLKETVQDLKKQLQEMSLQQEHLTRQVDGQRQMSHATSQPAIHSDFMYLQDGSQPVLNPYATLPHNVAKAALQQQAQQQHTYAMPYATQMDPMLSSQTIYQTPSQQIPFSIAQQQMQMDAYSAQLATSSPPQMLAGSQLGPTTQIASPPYLQQMTAGGGAMSPFVLHQQPPVALSPPIVTSPLVLPAGASYVNNVPDVNTNTFRLHQNNDQMQALPGSSMSGGVGVARAQHFHQQRSANDERVYDPQRELQQNISRQIDESDIRPPPPAHQQTPPKDPSSPPTTNTLLMQRHSATGGSQFIVDDIVPDKPAVGVTREMEAKREALLAKTLRRREQIEQRVEEIEARNAERRQAELEKQEAAELRKRERELQRQKILEDYKRKKMERELEANSGFQNGRGHSQPPTPSRPKSTVELAARSRTLQRPTRPQSSIDDTSAPSSARVTVASTAEPALKLFSKYVHKSNRSMIINALQYSVFPGAVSDKMRNEVLGELAKSDSKHFLLLFRDQKCRYMGAYSWDQQSDTAHRIHGRGPNMCHESMMHLMFKYDSGAKTFTRIPTKHLSATIDGFTLQDQFMQTPKIPHSGSISK